MSTFDHAPVRWIEVRTPDVHTKRFLDFDQLQVPENCTIPALISMYAQAVLELEAALIEGAILDGHNRIEVQREGQPTTVHTAPTWRFAFQSRLRVEWARWKHRHPNAGPRLWEALKWCGVVWSTGPIR